MLYAERVLNASHVYTVYEVNDTTFTVMRTYDVNATYGHAFIGKSIKKHVLSCFEEKIFKAMSG